MAELKLVISGDVKQAEQALKSFTQDVNQAASAAQSAGSKINSSLSRQIPNALPASAERASTAIKNLGKSSINTTQATVNFGRVLSDLPYGIQGVANNIDPLVASLGGPAGLGIAVTIATTGILLFSKTLASLFNPTDNVVESFKGAIDSFTQASSTVGQLRNEVELAKEGFINKDKVVEHYNETMGKTTGLVKTLDEVEKQLTQNGDAYIRMTLLKAAANISLGKAAEKAFEAEIARRKEAEKFLNVGDKLTSFGAGNVSAPGYVPNLQTQATQRQIAFDKEQSEKRKKAAIDNAESEQKTFENIAADLLKEAGKISKDFNFNFFDDTKEIKGKDPKKLRDEFINNAKQLNEELKKIGFLGPVEFSFFDSVETQLEKAKKVFADFNARDLKLNKDFFKIDLTFSEPKPEQVKEALGPVEQGIRSGVISVPPIPLAVNISPELAANADLLRDPGLIKAFRDIGKSLPTLDIEAPASFNRNVLVDTLRKFFGAGAQVTEEGLKNMADNFAKGLENINNLFANFKIQGITAFAEALGTALAGGSIRDIFSGFVNILADGLSAIGKQMIALSPVIGALKSALKSLNPAVLLPAGVALVAIGAALRSSVGKGITGFAAGGLVYGPTLGLVGEGVGTTRSNPEVIAPLDKLKGMLSDIGGSGSMRVQVVGVLRGDRQVLQTARTQRSQRRVFGR